jgi:hypothetical protein
MCTRLKHKQILRISSLTEGECITDAESRHIEPETWVSQNLDCITSWQQKQGIDCRPVAPLGCGWFCFFNPDEETLEVLRKAETCKPFDIDDETYPSLEYMEDEPGKRLEPKAFWLIELRRALSHFLAEKGDSQDVLAFRDYLTGETDRVMEIIKQSQK